MWLPPETRAGLPRGHYNLGLAHGVPGVIGFLGLVRAAGIAQDIARPLLDGAVSWLLAQRRAFDVGERFPIFVGEGMTIRAALDALDGASARVRA